ncbi:hypothetical protein PENTCL1PPCAC_8544, partial [Pristionchus entomophagus]
MAHCQQNDGKSNSLEGYSSHFVCADCIKLQSIRGLLKDELHMDGMEGKSVNQLSKADDPILKIAEYSEVSAAVKGSTVKDLVKGNEGIAYSNFIRIASWLHRIRSIMQAYEQNEVDGSLHYVAQDSEKLTLEISTVDTLMDELTDGCSCLICTEPYNSVNFIPRSLECGHEM